MVRATTTTAERLPTSWRRPGAARGARGTSLNWLCIRFEPSFQPRDNVVAGGPDFGVCWGLGVFVERFDDGSSRGCGRGCGCNIGGSGSSSSVSIVGSADRVYHQHGHEVQPPNAPWKGPPCQAEAAPPGVVAGVRISALATRLHP